MAKDPVCGMNVDEKAAKFTSSSGGKTWHFCSAGCKATFDKNPARFAM
ncbi:MAG: YHS domain-containing protein [Methanobacteriota archaeon]|nr:MAG: YHS domain-containing protein [Euryarchaeota archaeon]